MAFNKRQSFKVHNQNTKTETSKYEEQLSAAFHSTNEPTFTPQDYDNLIDAFKKIDANRTLTVRLDQLSPLMMEAHLNTVPAADMRHFCQTNGITKEITPVNFVQIYLHDKRAEAQADPGFRSGLSRVCSKKIIQMKTSGGVSGARATAFSLEETRAFAHWINTQLRSYLKDNGGLIDEGNPNALFERMGDGIITCMMLQKVSDGLVDDRAINWKITHEIHKHENLNLAINTAAAIGCVITGQHPIFIIEGRPNMCLGLIWQIIREGLFVKISLQENPYLARLLEDGETLEDLLKLSKEDLLLRWMNYQLKNNDNYEGGPVRNFSGDIKDSVAYQYLMEEIQPVNTGLVAQPTQSDLRDRAEATLDMADRLDCRQFVTADDIVKGHARLNMAFVANLYNNHPNLKPLDDSEVGVIEETREEKIYRNWMNEEGRDYCLSSVN
jgi:plastin-2